MSDAAKSEYVFYKHDGCYFRRKKDDPGVGIREILHGDEWVKYNGEDLVEPVYYGTKIEESEIVPD